MHGEFPSPYSELSRAETFAQVNELRAEGAAFMAQGDYKAAVDQDMRALDLVHSALGSLEEAGTERIPEIQQAGLLFSELALAQSMLGRVDQVGPSLRQALVYMGRAAELVPMMTGLDYCDHDRVTYRPDGDCQARPPCPRE